MTNEKFNEILIELLKSMYAVYGTEDMSSSFEATLVFDENQRIAVINNLKVNGELKSPREELAQLVEELNKIAGAILTFPETYKLKECYFSVLSGGEMSIKPTYLKS